MRPTPATLAILSVFVAGAVGAGIWLLGLESDCRARWRDSGLRAYYRDGTCLVEAGSRWVPEFSVKIWTSVDPQRDASEIRTAQESD